ncbi:Nuclear receptor corepressor 1-like protein [Drosera capensis]
MPPEPTPWGAGDRKEFFRDRRNSHDRAAESSSSAGLGPQHHPPPPGSGGGGGGRWKDSYGSRGDFGGGSGGGGRWGVGGGGPEFRRPPGHGKQGGWHAYHEEPSYGYSAPRSGNRFPENDGFRPFGPRGDERYARGYRDNRSYGQREWRGASWDNNDQEYGAVASVSVRPHEVNGQASSNDAFKRTSPRPNHLNSSDQFHHPSQAGKRIDENGSGTGRRTDRENSLDMDWRPLKWSRSGNLTSRVSNYNISSCSTSITDDACRSRTELLTQKSAPVEQYLGDLSTSTASAATSEENASRKKPRLGWGEGLAKYEKKRVEGPDEDANKTIETVASNNIEFFHTASSSVTDKNPRIPRSVDCGSPTTESSMPCGSSPGSEEKPLSKLAINNIDTEPLIGSPLPDTSVQKVVCAFNIGNFEPCPTSNFSTLLIELLQSEDQSLVYSGVAKASPLDKLMLWKEEITKALELTESEIDSLENEPKSFRPIPNEESSCAALQSSISMDNKELQKALSVIPTSAAQEVALSGEDTEEIPCSTGEGPNSEIKGGGLGSLGTASSKYLNPLCMQKTMPLDERTKISPADMDVKSPDLVQNPLVSSSNIERLAGPSDVGSNMVQESGISNCGQDCLAAGEDDVSNKILACNRVIAAEVSELLLKSVPISDFHSNHVNQTTIFCGGSKSLQKKFLQRKRFLKFKEKVLCIKYKAFQRLWKEDLCLLLESKHRAKSQKKSDPGLRFLHNGHQKHRSSVRSRSACPAVSLSLVPATEVISFIGKLLSDCKLKIYRDDLKMPALILDEKEKAVTRFISNNGLVDDPCAVEKGRALINPWTPEEKEIFIDKLANFGKDFRKIASFLDHKTAADCIEFYYKNHKSESFERTKKRPEVKKLEKSLSSNTYLVTTGTKWSRGMNSVSLDLLGEASAFAAHEDECLEASKVGSAGYCGKSRGVSGNSTRSRTYGVEDERETAAVDVLARICGSLSSEAVSSCITNSADPGENVPELKHHRFSSSSRCPLTPEATQDVDDETCSEESCGRMEPIDWTDEEKSIFVQSFSTYGRDFALISRRVQTKSRDQCKVFFSKARKCMGLDMICPDPSNGRTRLSDNLTGSGSDSDGACAIEARSDVSTDKSVSGLDEDFFVSTSDKKHKEAVDLQGEMKLMEHIDSGHLENLHLDIQKVDNKCKAPFAAEVSTKREIEECMAKWDQDNADADDLCSVKEETTAQDSAMPDDIVDTAAELLGVTGSSMSGDSIDTIVVNESSGDDPSVGEPANNVQKVLSAQHDAVQVSVGHDCSSEILKGYPLAFPVEEEADVSATWKWCPPEPNTQKDAQPLQVFSLRKCSHAESQNSVTELNFQYKSNTVSKKSDCQLPIPLGPEKPHSSGDVKLFGKILSTPSSAGKPSSHVTENKENAVHQVSSVGPFDIKGSVDCNMNGIPAVPKSDNIILKGSGDLPMRSYGFWDGTRIQRGNSTLPDSAMLLAKYPAAFENLPLASSNVDHQQQVLPNFITNACLLNGAPVLSTMKLPGSNGVSKDYQLKKSHDVLQPFGLELLQRPDLLNVQKNVYDEVPSYQPNDGRVRKLNVVMVDDHGSTRISDPVAALKLHFAKAHAAVAAAASSNPNGNGVVGAEESWRSQPGVGR